MIAERVSLSPNLISCLLQYFRTSTTASSTYRHGQRIVFVDNRNNIHIQKLHKGILGVQVLCPLFVFQQGTWLLQLVFYSHICYIVPRKKYLCNRLSIVGKKIVPESYKSALSHGRQCLLPDQLVTMKPHSWGSQNLYSR